MSAVGNGITNVCGLSRESTLKDLDFDYDALLDSNDALRERLTPLRREMEWLSVGPLKFENHFRGQPEPGVYRAGDALSFRRPFHRVGTVGCRPYRRTCRNLRGYGQDFSSLSAGGEGFIGASFHSIEYSSHGRAKRLGEQTNAINSTADTV